MNAKKIGRVNEEIRRIVSEIIINGLKDPRVDSLTSVTFVKTTNDLRYTNIYFSVYGDDLKKRETMEGLEKAKGFIRREIGRNLDLRIVPEPIFHLDTQLEEAQKMDELISRVVQGEYNDN